MALIDPRNFDEADMQSAKIGGAATKRTQDKSMERVIVKHVDTGEEIEASRQNVHDLAANGYKLIGPVPTKAEKIAASEKVAPPSNDGVDDTVDDGNGENDDESTDDEKKQALNELEILRQEADALGVKYHPNAGKRKLQEAIAIARAQSK